MEKKIRISIVLILLIVTIGYLIMVSTDVPTREPEYIEGFEKLVYNAHIEYMRCDTKYEQDNVKKYIISVYPEADPKHIKDAKLREFYKMCLEYDM